MLRYCIILLILLGCTSLFAQSQEPNDIKPDSSDFENIYVKKISEDSLHSTYIIWVKKMVPYHYHRHHTEHVYVIKGKAIMTLGDSVFKIKKGDLILIPAGIVHAVKTTSRKALKVVSIQSPRFDGDRVIIKK